MSACSAVSFFELYFLHRNKAGLKSDCFLSTYRWNNASVINQYVQSSKLLFYLQVYPMFLLSENLVYLIEECFNLLMFGHISFYERTLILVRNLLTQTFIDITKHNLKLTSKNTRFPNNSLQTRLYKIVQQNRGPNQTLHRWLQQLLSFSQACKKLKVFVCFLASLNSNFKCWHNLLTPNNIETNVSSSTEFLRSFFTTTVFRNRFW